VTFCKKNRYLFIFDMDGVIVNTEPLKFLAYKKVFRELYGVILDDNDVMWRGKSEKEVVKYWTSKKGIFCEIDSKEIIRKKRLFHRQLLMSNKLCLINGIREFISQLFKDSIKIGLATTSNKKDQRYIFKRFKLGYFFDKVVTLDDITRPKPDPEIYLKTADMLGYSHSKCIVFDDTPSGILAGIKAGMSVVAVLSSYKKKDFNNVRYFINDFSGLV